MSHSMAFKASKYLEINFENKVTEVASEAFRKKVGFRIYRARFNFWGSESGREIWSSNAMSQQRWRHCMFECLLGLFISRSWFQKIWISSATKQPAVWSVACREEARWGSSWSWPWPQPLCAAHICLAPTLVLSKLFKWTTKFQFSAWFPHWLPLGQNFSLCQWGKHKSLM